MIGQWWTDGRDWWWRTDGWWLIDGQFLGIPHGSAGDPMVILKAAPPKRQDCPFRRSKVELSSGNDAAWLKFPIGESHRGATAGGFSVDYISYSNSWFKARFFLSSFVMMVLNTHTIDNIYIYISGYAKNASILPHGDTAINRLSLHSFVADWCRNQSFDMMLEPSAL